VTQPESTPEATANLTAGAVQPPAPEGAEPAPPVATGAAHVDAAADAPIPGDRLGVPADATRVVADYGRPRPSYVFLALVSIISLAADIGTKTWAEHHLDGYPGTVEVWKGHLTLLLAKNRGGAWGLLQSTSENVRRPFFLLVSVAAIAFIMTLYRRLQPRQRALKWGLPLVLGGALGNVFDRIRYGHVIDFIDAHVAGEFSLRPFRFVLGHGPDHHWPTFNIADVAICVGVGLMAVDMFTSKRARTWPALRAPKVPPAQSGEPSVDWNGVVVEAPPPAAPLEGEGEQAAPPPAHHSEPVAAAETAAPAPPADPPADPPAKE
jgi:signal peptidase II